MIFLLTPEHPVDQEVNSIIHLLDAGLELLHIRRYQWTAKETAAYIRSIPEGYHSKLVLHAQHQLTQEFDICHVHYSERDRLQLQEMPQQPGVHYSTSVHDITSFNQLEATWDYAFLSPFFPSISKPGYGAASGIFQQLVERSNTAVKLIALGGINTANIAQTLASDVDGVAVLGAIWQSNDRVKAFRDCRTAMLHTNK